LPTDLKRFEFIAYFVGAYVADVVLKSGRKKMSPEEIAMIVDRALDNLRGRDGASDGQAPCDVERGEADGELKPEEA
jgi:hypothetical protein